MKKIFLIIFLTQLLFTGCDILSPRSSNYSNKILFTSERSGIKQLYIIDPDGTNIEQITSGVFSHEWGRWSPNADKIVCTTSQWMTSAGMFMMTIKPNGTGGTLLSYGNSFEWHPDSNLIIYNFMPSAELVILHLIFTLRFPRVLLLIMIYILIVEMLHHRILLMEN